MKFDAEDFLKKKRDLYEEYNHEKIIESIGVKVIHSFSYCAYTGLKRAALAFYDGSHFDFFYEVEDKYKGIAQAESPEDIQEIQRIFLKMVKSQNRKEGIMELFERLTYCSGRKDSDAKAYYILAQKVKEIMN
jgi:hypothetical protein